MPSRRRVTVVRIVPSGLGAPSARRRSNTCCPLVVGASSQTTSPSATTTTAQMSCVRREYGTVQTRRADPPSRPTVQTCRADARGGCTSSMRDRNGRGGLRRLVIVNMAHVGVDRAGRGGYRSRNAADVTARAVSGIADASVCHFFSGRDSTGNAARGAVRQFSSECCRARGGLPRYSYLWRGSKRQTASRPTNTCSGRRFGFRALGPMLVTFGYLAPARRRAPSLLWVTSPMAAAWCSCPIIPPRSTRRRPPCSHA